MFKKVQTLSYSAFLLVSMLVLYTKAQDMPIADECGGDLELLEQLIRSPNYPTQAFPTRKYEPNLDCVWTKETPLDTLTMIKFWDISIEPGREGGNTSCDYDYLNVSIQSLGWEMFCGFYKPEEPLRGFGTLKLHFHSDDSVTYRGFQATYQMVEDFSSCEPNPCNTGTCTMIRGEIYPTCDCGPGTSGRYCEIDIQECDSNPCINGGTCDDTRINHYKCNCPTQWEGTNCERAKQDPCLSTPCKYDGECLSREDFTFTCKCKPGYKGDICDTKTGCGNPGIPYLHIHRRFNEGTKLVYSCVEDYIMVGTNHTTCYRNGSWSHLMPQCIKNVTEEERSESKISPYSSVMIGLGATLVVNITVFFTYMVYKSPWSILDKLRVTFTSQPPKVTSDPLQMTSSPKMRQQTTNSDINISQASDDVFELSEYNKVVEHRESN